MTNDEILNFLIDMIGVPTEMQRGPDGKIVSLMFDAFSSANNLDVSMRIDTVNKTVAIREIDGRSKTEDTYLYHVEDLGDAYRIWQYVMLDPSGFAYEHGYTIWLNENIDTATNETGETAFVGTQEQIKRLIFEQAVGVSVRESDAGGGFQ